MSNQLQDHYRRLLQDRGDDATAVQYSDRESQHRRFSVLADVAVDLESVLDLGCGLGHFLEFLRARGFAGRYLGLDMLPEFIATARERHAGDPLAEFRTADLETDEFPEGFDTHVVCGVFNNTMPDNAGFMQKVLRKSYAAAGRQIAFNAMSTYVDFQVPELYYTDPCNVFDFCKRELGRRIVLRHEYLVRHDRPPFEYTMYVYK